MQMYDKNAFADTAILACFYYSLSSFIMIHFTGLPAECSASQKQCCTRWAIEQVYYKLHLWCKCQIAFACYVLENKCTQLEIIYTKGADSSGFQKDLNTVKARHDMSRIIFCTYTVDEIMKSKSTWIALRDSSPKNKSLISCSFKLIWLSFFCRKICFCPYNGNQWDPKQHILKQHVWGDKVTYQIQ